MEEPLMSSSCPCCVQKASCVTAPQADLLGAAWLVSDSFSVSCSSSHNGENPGLFLSWTGPRVHAGSAAPDEDLHTCRKRWVTWVQFDIFYIGELAEMLGFQMQRS